MQKSAGRPPGSHWGRFFLAFSHWGRFFLALTAKKNRPQWLKAKKNRPQWLQFAAVGAATSRPYPQDYKLYWQKVYLSGKHSA